MKTRDARFTRTSNFGFRVKYRRAGFTLIELMIAITITLFLVAGVVGIVMSVRGTFKTQDGLTQIQETQRFFLTAVDNTVRLAGYFVNPLVDTSTSALPATTTANPDGTIFIAGQSIGGTTGSGANSDSVNVRYQVANNDGLMNCQGDTNSTGASLVWSNSFAVNASHQLTCTISVNGGAPGTPVILVDNVATVKILYGVDTDGDNSVDKYLSSADVVAASCKDKTPAPLNCWLAVSSVQLTITLLDPVNSTPGVNVNLPKTILHTINLMSQT
jgi:type IV pilus assembly protein PilW